VQDSFQREREALKRLLESGAFSRSPNLERILVYLCEKYFRGEGPSVKEFHLATEVLGRPETFDPKKDSIVRVEIHRLRKRLRDHYGKHPSDPVRILLPEKSYIPEFQNLDGIVTAPQAQAPQDKLEPVPAEAHLPAPVGKRGISFRHWSAAAAVALVMVSGGWIWSVSATGEPRGTTTAPANTAPRGAEGTVTASNIAPVPDPVPVDRSNSPEIRILAGRPPGRYVDRYGKTWEGDRYFKGGESVNVAAEIRTAGWDANLFSGMREGNFEYEIPLPPGYYELTLLFAETALGEGRPLGTESHRVFTITANDKPLITSFDVLADAIDPNVAWIRRFKDLTPDVDGKLKLRFYRASGTKPFLNALILTPGVKGRMRPLRMVCRNQAFRDNNDVVWEPDHYFHGGTPITRPHGAPAGDHFQGERFGYFSYNIPVPAGKYGARLYFWEYWWGPNQPGKGGVGSRIFDVFCNHKPLLLDFDIIKRNPKEQTVVETFHGLEPDSRGILAFDFIAKANYALINAIEIFDEVR
jgi:hypothetical protein